MKIQEFAEWIEELKEKVPIFVKNMAVTEHPGRYRLSWSGDIPPTRVHWGLAEATYAARLLFIFDALTNTLKRDISTYILSFARRDGSIHDDYIQKATRRQRWKQGIRQKSLEVILNKINKRTETRQALAGLMNLGVTPGKIYTFIPFTKSHLKTYIESLPWMVPWAAGSLINNLLFFIWCERALLSKEKDELITCVEESLKPFWRDDGAFYPENTRHVKTQANQKIGSAMKVLMGMSLVGREQNWIRPALLDLTLDAVREDNACVTFNTIYVVTKALPHTLYRQKEALDFLQATLSLWKHEYYWEEYGGFSFFKRKAITEYHGADVTKGLAEPDLHGTAMFCWGIYLIAKALGMEREYGLHGPVL